MSTFIEIIACLFIAYAALPLMSSAGQAWPGRACFSQAPEPIAELLTLGSRDGAPTKMHASERPVLHMGPVRAQVRVGLVVPSGRGALRERRPVRLLERDERIMSLAAGTVFDFAPIHSRKSDWVGGPGIEPGT